MKYYSLLLLLFISNCLCSQDQYDRISLGTSVGVNYFTQNSHFNNYLIANGYPTISTLFNMNFDDEIKFNRYIGYFQIGGSSGILNAGNSSISNSTQYKGMVTEVGIGYSLINREKWDIFPSIGFRAQNTNANLVKSDSISDVFGNSLAISKSTKIESFQLSLLLKLSYRYNLFRWFTLGVNLGYGVLPYNELWKNNDKEKPNIPLFKSKPLEAQMVFLLNVNKFDF